MMEEHRRGHEDRERWRALAVGQEIIVVKQNPHGTEAARYPAVVVERVLEDAWMAVHARWTYHRVEIDGLVFEPGDDLIEWFSPRVPFNAFAVLSPAGDLRGWYANVTYPAYLEMSREIGHASTLVWHDLYLDVVGLPDGSFVMRDEDELAESGLETSNPLLHAEIISAAEELVRRFTAHDLPFRVVHPTMDPRQSQNESV